MKDWPLQFLLGALLMVSSIASVSAVEDQSPSTTEEPVTQGYNSVKFVPKFFKILDGPELQTLKMSSSLGVVCFYKHQSSREFQRFLVEYDKSAGFLNAYGITLALIDCNGPLTDSLEQACKEANESLFYTYRNGKLELELDQDTMFDVNSIMSNILQLALLSEVSIVQTIERRQQLEHESAGQTDLVLSYNSAIGTYEHRVFMEIAYAYQDKYKFAVSTESATFSGLQDAESMSKRTEFMMWILCCRESYDVASGCRSVNYRGDFTLVALAKFFQQLNWPRVVYRSDKTEKVHPCEEAEDAVCVYIFYSAATKDQADRVIESIQFDLHGMAGLIVQQQMDADGVTDAKVQDPQLSIRKPEGDYTVMEESWNLENVEVFISSHLFTSRNETEKAEEISKTDDIVMHIAFHQPANPKIASNIPSLTDDTFYTFIGNNKLLLVLFYIPFDSQGILFLGPYQDAGKELAAAKGDNSSHPLARVNCFDWTDVCQKENISSYPVITIYRDGQRQQYQQALDKDVLVRTVRLLEAEQPLLLKSTEEVERFMRGDIPEEVYKTVDNLVLLKPTKSHKEMQDFSLVVKALETQMLFAVVSADIDVPLIAEGGLLHVRLTDKQQQHETLTENLDFESMYKFLLKGQFHVLPELTPLNFPALLARKQPFGILFFNPEWDDSLSLQLTMVDIIQTNKVPAITFCKMSMTGDNAVAEAILHNYTESLTLPSFAIVNHHKGEVYVLQGMQLLDGHLLPWIKDVQDGILSPTKILKKGEWKPPGKHFDFLAKMDQKKKEQKSKRDSGLSAEGQRSEIEAAYDGQDQDEEVRSALLELSHSRLYTGRNSKLAGRAERETTVLPAAVDSNRGGSTLTQHQEL